MEPLIDAAKKRCSIVRFKELQRELKNNYFCVPIVAMEVMTGGVYIVRLRQNSMADHSVVIDESRNSEDLSELELPLNVLFLCCVDKAN